MTLRRRLLAGARRLGPLLATLAVLLAGSPGAVPPAQAAAPTCTHPPPGAAYAARVGRALRSGRDVWGNALLAAPQGPTLAGASRYLQPLLLARGRGKTPLTESGVYYLPFAQPLGPHGAGSVALHLADGSQVVSDRIGSGRGLTVSVGAAGGEPYGSCLARLVMPRLAGGYLPILQTRYVDRAGARYRQESFAARIAETDSLVSFVRVTVDAARAHSAVRVRFGLSANGLTRSGDRLVRGGAVHLVFGADGRVQGSSVSYAVPRGETRTVFVALLDYPQASGSFALDEEAYMAARESVMRYWEGRLADGASITVPERQVNDALRGLLVQNLALTWRYSIGNPYEQFSFPEGVDAAQVMGEWGHAAVAQAMLRSSLTRKPTPYPNWKMGEKLVGSASYYRLTRDTAYVDAATPTLRGYVAVLGRQIEGGAGLLARERYSSDIPDSVYGLHSQAVVWQGLREMGAVWAETGRRALAGRCGRLASRLEAALRRAVRLSARRLGDGSLFVPVRLLDREEPYEHLTASRAGSYWNLVMPYALASGLFRPDGAEVTGVLRYLLRHGSRLLGLVRAGAFALYRDPVFPTSGTDQVYGINMARFLSDNDEADQLALSLYGMLAAAMTQRTFVSGEAASVAPLLGSRYRAMYLPPNGAGNAAFLATLRLMLVHETRNRAGRPDGLRLAFSTPRAWLAPGKRTAVERVPTSFGPVSFTLDARRGNVQVALELPARRPVRGVQLRLRLPRGNRLTGVTLDGRAWRRFDPRAETIDLAGQRGSVTLVARYGSRA